MVAKLIFFYMCINWPSSPGFRVKIILNFKHDNKVIRTNLYSYKILLIWLPFMNKVYTWFGSSIAFNMNHDHVELAMKFLRGESRVLQLLHMQQSEFVDKIVIKLIF